MKEKKDMKKLVLIGVGAAFAYGSFGPAGLVLLAGIILLASN